MDDQPLRVAIIEDEDDVELLLRVQLRRVDDIEVVGSARDGEAALDLCRRERPDAVVVDLLLPGMNGIRMLEVLRAELPDVAPVAYTAVAGEYVRAEMARLGVPLLLKSGDPTPLLEAIRAAAGPRHAAS